MNDELSMQCNSVSTLLLKVQVHLPALANIPTYIPPPVTEVMSISFGTSGKPIYGVKTSSGVSAACLPAYFEASGQWCEALKLLKRLARSFKDAYRQRLENEIGYFAGQTDTGNNQISQVKQIPAGNCKPIAT